MEEKKIISLKEIEEALNNIVVEHPDLNFGICSKSYIGVDDDLNNIYIANIGSITHPLYIAGTEEKINEQIEEFHRRIREELDKNGSKYFSIS